eukprot:8866148-Prorocentrum_lima.AAC.1
MSRESQEALRCPQQLARPIYSLSMLQTLNVYEGKDTKQKGNEFINAPVNRTSLASLMIKARINNK